MTEELFDSLMKHTDSIFDMIKCENKCAKCTYSNLCKSVVVLQEEISKMFAND